MEIDYQELEDPTKLTAPLSNAEDKWDLVPSFFQVKTFVRQHIESFNWFVDTEIKKIVDANSVIKSDADPSFFLRFVDVRVGTPILVEDMISTDVTPQQCRLRDMSYTAPITADIEYTKQDKVIAMRNFQIGQIPIMLRSNRCVLNNKTPAELTRLGECPMDPGGYFVVKGTERVILMQEQLSKNRVILESDSKNDPVASCTSSTHERKTKTNVAFRRGKLYLVHNSFTEDIPLIIAMKALEVESDLEIAELIGSDKETLDILTASFLHASSLGVYSCEQARNYIGKRARQRNYLSAKPPAYEARDILARTILCHIPCERDLSSGSFAFQEKAIYTAYMARRVISHVRGLSPLDDKDYFGNKRVELTGDLLSLLFEDAFKRLCSDIQKVVDNTLSKSQKSGSFDAIRAVRQDIISNAFITAISSGNWNLARFRMERSGVTQVLSRLSYMAALGMMTRITSQFDSGIKSAEPRWLQPSQWGMVCVSDTPEGHSCGLTKNLSLLCDVTVDQDPTSVRNALYNLGVEEIITLSGKEIFKNYTVFLNGALIGIHRSPARLVTSLRQLRRSGYLHHQTSIAIDELSMSVNVSCDGGRVCRPLIVVDNGVSRITDTHMAEVVAGKRSFDDCVREGLIEYLDVPEEAGVYIALYERELTMDHTHLEISPVTILGLVAGLVPYPHHNQSPRNTYQCAMGKQAIGAIALNQYERIDTLLYLICYPQKPLVKSKILDLTSFHNLPAGQNAMIAVMSYSGYDIEDAIVINQCSIDRGYARAVVLKKHATKLTEDENLGGYPVDENGKRRNIAKWDFIDSDGLPAPDTTLSEGSILVSKVVNGRPAPESFKQPTDFKVDRVLLTSNPQNKIIAKIRYRQTRRPEPGDKFSSRHGQKGVCGLIVHQNDFAFTEEGVCPDAIMNPHGFPSRMTIGKMIELIAGKVGILEGHQGDGTIFSGDKVSHLAEKLVQHGYSYHGKDFLYSGITGEPLAAYIFFGPVYYQRLKHMVRDKMHARSTGPRAVLTRQPTEGRSKDGGLRLGEMEKDCLIAYGATNLMLERLMKSSDETTVSVCEKCGCLGYPGWCQSCRTGAHISPVIMPYACKLLFQEMTALNVVPKLSLKNADQVQ